MQKQNTEVLPDLYTNFAQFKYAVGNMGPSTDIKYDMYILYYTIYILLRHLTGIRCYLKIIADFGLFLYL